MDVLVQGGMIMTIVDTPPLVSQHHSVLKICIKCFDLNIVCLLDVERQGTAWFVGSLRNICISNL